MFPKFLMMVGSCCLHFYDFRFFLHIYRHMQGLDKTVYCQILFFSVHVDVMK